MASSQEGKQVSTFDRAWAAYVDRTVEELQRMHRDGAPHLAAILVEQYAASANWHTHHGDSAVAELATNLAAQLSEVHGAIMGRTPVMDGAS